MVAFVQHLSVAFGLGVLVVFVPGAAAWAQEPAQEPATPTVTVTMLAEDQFWVLGFGLVLLVFLLSAHVVGSWRK